MTEPFGFYVAAKPAVLRVLPGTPREALEKWKPPPWPKPIKPRASVTGLSRSMDGR